MGKVTCKLTMSKKDKVGSCFTKPLLLNASQLAAKSSITRPRKLEKKQKKGKLEKQSTETSRETFETMEVESNIQKALSISSSFEEGNEQAQEEEKEQEESDKPPPKRKRAASNAHLQKMCAEFKSERIVIDGESLFCEACFKNVSPKKSTLKGHIVSDTHINGKLNFYFGLLSRMFTNL